MDGAGGFRVDPDVFNGLPGERMALMSACPLASPGCGSDIHPVRSPAGEALDDAVRETLKAFVSGNGLSCIL